MEGDEAIIFCDDDTMQKIPPEYLDDLRTRHSVEINYTSGRFMIPASGVQGANYWAKKELIEYVNYFKNQPAFQWCWQKDQMSAMPYEEEHNRQIEESFNRREAQTEISLGNKTFIVDFIYYCQRPENSQITRMIFRNPPPTLPDTQWMFHHEGTWKNFNRETSDMCERAKNGNVQMIQVPFGKMGGRNVIDFERMVMQDARGNLFSIKRKNR